MYVKVVGVTSPTGSHNAEGAIVDSVKYIGDGIAVLPDGSMVNLGEELMVYIGRVSSSNRDCPETAPRLINYLIKHKHWSPFEMINFVVEFETSRAMGREILRHRSCSFQEFSQRYAEVPSFEFVELRKQCDNNRQSSTEVVESEFLSAMSDQYLEDAQNFYSSLIGQGVARECARMFLPECATTTIIMNGTLRSWIHFFEQRCSPHAQKEIRILAEEARRLISKYTPWTAEALEWEICDE